MKISYFRERKEEYLTVGAGACGCPAYQLRMLQQNPVAGVLYPSVREMDGDLLYDYRITGYRSLREYGESRPLPAALLKTLAESLCRISAELDRYMIDEDYLALSPDFLFLWMSEEGDRVNCCFFPFQGREDARRQMRELAEFLVEKADSREKEAVNLAYGLFQEAAQCGSLAEMPELLRRWMSDGEEDAPESGAVKMSEAAANARKKTAEPELCAPGPDGTEEAEGEILWTEERRPVNRPAGAFFGRIKGRPEKRRAAKRRFRKDPGGDETGRMLPEAVLPELYLQVKLVGPEEYARMNGETDGALLPLFPRGEQQMPCRERKKAVY